MTPGEIAYREDVRRQPVYPFNGRPRATWDELGDDIRANWEKYPTPRAWGKADAAVVDVLTAALESIVALERNGGSATAMRMTAQGALDLAKGN